MTESSIDMKDEDKKNVGENKDSNENNQPFFVSSLDLKIAARLVIDGKEFRNITFKQSDGYLKSYEFYLNKWVTIILFVTFIIHLFVLPIFEEPAYTEIPYWIPCAIELLCLIVYTSRIIHSRVVQDKKDFYGDKKNLVIIIIILLTLIDIIAYLMVKSLNIKFVHRYTRVLRVLFYINFNEAKELRRAFRNVRRTLPDVLNVFVLFLSSLVVFSFLGWQAFRREDLKYFSSGLPYFKYFEDSIWDMYVSVTTANFPDVMMPAYEENGAYAIFFIVFMLINLYIFINIILAAIYSNYKKHLKNEVKETILLRRNKLETAFNILKLSSVNSNENGTINYDTFFNLLKLIDPEKSNYQIKILFDLLDLDGDKALTLKEFLYLADLLNVRITEVKDRQTLVERFLPNIYNSKISFMLRKIVRHRFFSIPFDVLIVINVVLLIVEKNEAEWFFLTAFLIEILLRIYVLGAREFFKRYWNIFDTLIIMAGFIIGIIEATMKTGDSTKILEIVLILRLLRILKLLASIERFRVVITTIANITPSLLTYASLLLTIYYIFAMIGMELFSGLIKENSLNTKDCGNPNLNNTEFAKLNYCKNNFNNFPNSLVLMFELMVVNQWHVLSQGFVAATTKWARLFFFTFHLSCVIVSLNIFTAFILEAFLLEYETNQKTLFETKIEGRIIELGLNLDDGNQNKVENTNQTDSIDKKNKIIKTIKELYGTDETDMSKIEGVKFHINPKGPKSVDILLQRMFSQEFDITQDDILKND